MVADQSLWGFFANASPLVKGVMLILLLLSVLAWTVIFQRGMFLKRARRAISQFEQRFWSGADLSQLYSELNTKRTSLDGLEFIFQSGFREFARLRQQVGVNATAVMEGAKRAMRGALTRETENLETHLSFLATVGSTSPYIGLFGTVWGIMTAFHALGTAQQATIAMVAPGISEALIATALGLFAAIPAVIAYNRFSNDVERLLNRYDMFQEEFASILYRQAHAASLEQPEETAKT